MKSVFGLVDSEKQADRIITALQNNGFSSEDISILFADKNKTESFENQRARKAKTDVSPRNVADSDFTSEDVSRETTLRNKRSADTDVQNLQKKHDKKGSLGHEKHTKAPEGGVTGATAGGILGGSLGLLAGIGALAIPGMGPFIAAGPIMAALSGSAIGGSLGLLIGSLVGLGIPEYEAKKYEKGLKSGQVLIAVHTTSSDEVDRAKEILKKEGAKDIASSTEKTGIRR